MKRIALLICLTCLLTLAMQAQIPNNSFETWVTNPAMALAPEHWITMNSIVGSNVLQSTPGYNSNTAAELKPINLFGSVNPAFLYSEPFPISQRYEKLNCYVKGAPMGTDSLYIVADLFRDDTVPVAGGAYFGAPVFSAFTYLEIQLFYYSNDFPDSAAIAIWAGGVDTTYIGTSYIIDELSFSGNVGINELSRDLLVTGPVYPTPAMEEINIPFALAEASGIHLVIYDALGRQIVSKPQGMFTKGSHRLVYRVEGMKSGWYFYTLMAETGQAVTGKFMVK
jgi:hypothetical protein